MMSLILIAIALSSIVMALRGGFAMPHPRGSYMSVWKQVSCFWQTHPARNNLSTNLLGSEPTLRNQHVDKAKSRCSMP